MNEKYVKLSDAQDIIESITCDVTSCCRCPYYTDDSCNVLSELFKLPTVDLPQITHCSECKHWGTGVAGETESVKCCEYAHYMVGANGYCVYGELRGVK